VRVEPLHVHGKAHGLEVRTLAWSSPG
jgi:hypothetical protein